jgi:hypothetical protein
VRPPSVQAIKKILLMTLEGKDSSGITKARGRRDETAGDARDRAARRPCMWEESGKVLEAKIALPFKYMNGD